MCAALPTDSRMLCRYVVDLSGSVKYRTIQNYVSGVISLNNYFGHDVKYIRSEFDFITTMAGIRRVLGDPTPVRPSFTINDLESMYKFVDLNSADDRCMWACLALSFRSLLRKSNLVPDSVANPIGHFIRRGALSFTEWGMEISVSSSKTVQYGQKVFKVPVTLARGSSLCAASLVLAHCREFPSTDPMSPVFVIRKGVRIVPLTYSVLLAFLKKLMRKARIDKDRAGMHSMRRAGALYMYNLGLTIEDIRQAGDWASMAALLYLTKPYQSRIDTDLIVSKGLVCGWEM